MEIISLPRTAFLREVIVTSSDVIKAFFQDQDQDFNFKTKTKTKNLKFFQDQDQDQA